MDSKAKAIRFRTEIGEPSDSLGLDYAARFFTIGSCFSDAVGTRLQNLKFQTAVNLFGTVYDPLSIHRLLHYAIENQIPDRSSYVERDGIFFCDEFHSSVWATTADLLEEKISSIIRTAHDYLKQVDVLLLTYGTAWIYRRKDSGKQVANCHKLPSTFFEKRLLTVSEITASFSLVSERLRILRPQSKILLTVSPVRHVKETLEGNSVSKAILRLAIHQSLYMPWVSYYPAFEILTDDLRDYRYYEGDLIHPNSQAIEYIWTHFSKMMFTEQTLVLMESWNKIRQALEHRPFHPHSDAHKKFLLHLRTELYELAQRLPLQHELLQLDQQINDLKV